MANIPRYNDDEINNKGMEVDFDLRKVFNMPTIEQLIFFHVNFDKCRKEIITYEKAIQDSSSRKSICLFKVAIFLFASWSGLILFQLDALFPREWVIWNPWRQSHSSGGGFESLHPYFILNFIIFNLFLRGQPDYQLILNNLSLFRIHSMIKVK